MRNLYTLLIVVGTFCLYSTGLGAQDFTALLKSGNYSELARHFDHEVNIEFKRDRQTLSREKAINAIKRRMKEFGPVKWETMHEGKSNGKEDNYIIAKVYNNKNKGLRIFMHIEEIDGEKKICSVRFRKLLR